MPIILYGSRLSPFVEKVYRGLMLKRLPFQLHEPHSPLDMRRNNPTTSKMPVLDLEGKRLYDSTFILQALDAFKPDPPLLASDPMLAAQQRLLEDWADESLYWYGIAFRWGLPANAKRSVEVITANVPPILRPLAKLVAPRIVRLQMWGQGTGRLPFDVLKRELDAHLANLVRLLGAGPFFFAAARPSVADLAVFGQLSFLHSPVTPEGKAAIQKHEELFAWYRRFDFLTD